MHHKTLLLFLFSVFITTPGIMHGATRKARTAVKHIPVTITANSTDHQLLVHQDNQSARLVCPWAQKNQQRASRNKNMRLAASLIPAACVSVAALLKIAYPKAITRSPIKQFGTLPLLIGGAGATALFVFANAILSKKKIRQAWTEDSKKETAYFAETLGDTDITRGELRDAIQKQQIKDKTDITTSSVQEILNNLIEDKKAAAVATAKKRQEEKERQEEAAQLHQQEQNRLAGEAANKVEDDLTEKINTTYTSKTHKSLVVEINTASLSDDAKIRLRACFHNKRQLTNKTILTQKIDKLTGRDDSDLAANAEKIRKEIDDCNEPDNTIYTEQQDQLTARITQERQRLANERQARLAAEQKKRDDATQAATAQQVAAAQRAQQEAELKRNADETARLAKEAQENARRDAEEAAKKKAAEAAARAAQQAEQDRLEAEQKKRDDDARAAEATAKREVELKRKADEAAKFERLATAQAVEASQTAQSNVTTASDAKRAAAVVSDAAATSEAASSSSASESHLHLRSVVTAVIAATPAPTTTTPDASTSSSSSSSSSLVTTKNAARAEELHKSIKAYTNAIAGCQTEIVKIRSLIATKQAIVDRGGPGVQAAEAIIKAQNGQITILTDRIHTLERSIKQDRTALDALSVD